MYRAKLIKKCNVIVRSLNLVFRSEKNDWKYIDDEDIDNPELNALKHYLIIEKAGDTDGIEENVVAENESSVKCVAEHSFVVDINDEIKPTEPEAPKMIVVDLPKEITSEPAAEKAIESVVESEKSIEPVVEEADEIEVVEDADGKATTRKKSSRKKD